MEIKIGYTYETSDLEIRRGGRADSKTVRMPWLFCLSPK